MAKSYLEIERKFLVRGPWPAPLRTHHVRQIYLNPGTAISTRLRDMDGNYSLTLKAGVSATTRHEYDIPLEENLGADMMAHFAGPTLIEKKRHIIAQHDFIWEVDVFSTPNAGLIVAEIELPFADTVFTLPEWVGREVTHDGRFTNHALSVHPFERWGVTYEELL
jgi:CYTH domain-containing protein